MPRILLILLGTIAGLWLSLAVTLPAVYKDASVDLSVGGWPSSLVLRVRDANRLLSGKSADERDAGIRLLARAASTEPLEASGFRDLGLLLDARGDHEQARRLLAYSHSLSRRDVPTEMWLIEDRVAAADIPGILVHYDHGLRTSRQLQTVLMPTLVAASADPLVAEPLGRMLASKPPWWIPFADYLAVGISNPRTASRLLGALQLDPEDPRERADLVSAISRLVALGAYQEARSLSQQAARGAVLPAVANGSFEEREGLPPFSWEFQDDPSLAAAPEPRDGAAGTMALSLIAASDRSGTVARQLILLAPGRYRLTGLVGEVAGAEAQRPAVALACVNSADAPLHQFTLPSASGVRRIQESFVVPVDCPAQWLSVVIRSGSDSAAEAPWIDHLQIVSN